MKLKSIIQCIVWSNKFRTFYSPPEASEVRLVLTVPAIWSDEAKAFMREAAQRVSLVFFILLYIFFYFVPTQTYNSRLYHPYHTRYGLISIIASQATGYEKCLVPVFSDFFIN